MLKVGITGGIGSGKSTVSKIFESLRIPVFNSDLVAKQIVNTSKETIEQIKKSFGESIYSEDGRLNRKKMASIVFQDNEKLKTLNNIIHPAVGSQYEKWLDENSNAPYSIKEAAILFETGGYLDLDKMIVVSAPESLRIRRVVLRDNVSEKEVKSRISKQWEESKKVEMADYVIYNNEKDMIIPQVIKIHEELLKI